MVLRWRRRPDSGRGREPVVHELRGNCGPSGAPTVLAIVQEAGDSQWFWYSMMPECRVNTCRTPDTLDACKAEAKAAAKEVIRGRAMWATGILIKSLFDPGPDAGQGIGEEG